MWGAVTPERYRRLRSALSRRQPDLTIMLDRVNKAHNLSAVIRSAESVGLLEVHAASVGAVPEISKSPARGAAKWTRLVTHESTQDGLEALKKRGFLLVGADVGPDSVSFREVDYTQPTAIVMGAEKYGLSEDSRRLVDRLIHIPMMGLSGSLNVSVAAGLILYEAQRQRWEAGLYEDCRLAPDQFASLLFEWCYPLVSAYCREKQLEYPSLDDEGRPVGSIEGMTVEAIRAVMRERERGGLGVRAG